ncbi:MAG: nucleotidyltransferase domain-containing protein [Gammaproteobacteria bacterium]|nr:nucleotidyltransferase domain-containing protein [Gammaproteobacteria bacterium]
MVVTEHRGNRKHFQANPDSPVFQEICSIVDKTLGLPGQVRAALQPINAKIHLALIYGSVASQSDTADSDIDLLIVSDDLTLERLYLQLAEAEKNLGRRINPTLYTTAEYQHRITDRNPFLTRVLEQSKILLVGDII